MKEPREIAENIFLIRQGGASYGIKPPMNIYVIAGEDGLIFDAGFGNSSALKKVRDGVRKIEGICRERGSECRITRVLASHTHPDHFSGLSGMREKMGLKVLLTPGMYELIKNREKWYSSYRDPEREHGIFSHPRNGLLTAVMTALSNAYFRISFGLTFMPDPDEIVEEESLIMVNGEEWLVMAGPGHCDNHVMLYNRERGLLLAGDNVLRSITTWLGPPRSNLKDYISTLQRIRELPGLKRILSAHGSSIENPVERIDDIINYRDMRTREIEGIIKDSGNRGITFHHVVEKVYPKMSPLRRRLVEGWIITTIQHLEAEARIRRCNVSGRMGFMHDATGKVQPPTQNQQMSLI